MQLEEPSVEYVPLEHAYLSCSSLGQEYPAGHILHETKLI